MKNIGKAISSLGVCAVAVLAMRWGGGDWGCYCAPVVLLLGLSIIWEEDERPKE